MPIYAADALTRRAPSLQLTTDARTAARATMNGATASRLGLVNGGNARVTQDGGEAILMIAIDDRMPIDCVRIPAGLPATATLGAMTGAITVERAE